MFCHDFPSRPQGREQEIIFKKREREKKKGVCDSLLLYERLGFDVSLRINCMHKIPESPPHYAIYQDTKHILQYNSHCGSLCGRRIQTAV